MSAARCERWVWVGGDRKLTCNLTANHPGQHWYEASRVLWTAHDYDDDEYYREAEEPKQ